jgi:flagellar hook-associated protein 1 FlgK
MTLFSSIHLASNALSAMQLGLHVTGNNIANANTPGYIRERLVLSPAPTMRYGGLLLGLGVQVDGIVQITDRFLEERLRGAASDLANGEAQEDVYVQLEALIGELSDTDLSTSLTTFFNSIHDILNQPESASVRNLAVMQGGTLADDIRRLNSRVRTIREDTNNQIVAAADDINALLEEIAELNIQIVELEGGGSSGSDAVGLRDRRGKVLGQLAEIIDIRIIEQPTGDVTVFTGGEYLVSGTIHRPVSVTYSSDRGLNLAEIRIAETDAPISLSSGRLAGQVQARDAVLGGFLDGLDEFARALAFEFNKIFAGGQGLVGHTSLESEFAVTDVDANLDAAGLQFTPVNGGFSVQVLNTQTGLRQTVDVRVDLNGMDEDISLADLAAELDAIDGISATITASRKLKIESESPTVQFAFDDDTSGVLAALGLNTFFTGTGAADIGVSSVMRADPAKFAASGGGIGEDSENAERLAILLTEPLASFGDASLAQLYDRMTADVTQGAAVTRSVAEGFRVFQRTLEGEHMAISGVNIDEETVRMIGYQRTFQASARVISTINELLGVLIDL